MPELMFHRGAPGIRLEALDPTLDRRRLRRQSDGVSANPLSIGRVEVLEQDPPRDAVDDEMMGNE
jgi:hypothetical protein